MNLFELSAKISVDDSGFKKSMENAQKVSKNVATAMKNLQSPLDKAKSGFNAIAHPVETAKANIEKLKNATEAIRHPIETFKNKVADASTALETKRNKLSTLAAGYDSAKKKVADITKEFNKSAKESGTSSQKTQELAKKLNEAEKEAEEAKKELDDYSASVSRAGKNSDSASKGVGNFASKLGKGLATAGKVAGAALGVAAAGVTALTTAAVNNHAEYEQLVGGVETLFQGSQKSFDEFTKSIGTSWSDIAKYQKEAGLAVTGWLDTSTLESLQAKYEDMSKAMANAHNVVLENAANAYKTAGMSANEYMSTVTSFSASLIQSLGGDTAAAAEYADRAIISMSDNANKMGTSIDMIQNAYQGFAKQNYTMLDNLKLGYGGTQTEMQRLIEDASKMTDVQERLGITVDKSSMSFDNIVNAIQVVQENMGIAGATALEAGTTIEGSVNSMKAAWQNLLTGLADGNADIGKLVDNLVTTIVGDGTESNLGVLGNVMPAVKTALAGASKLVSELLPKIVQEIPSIINENLPVLAEAAVSIIQSLVDGISQNQAMLMSTAIETIMFLADNLIMMLPQIVALGLELIVSLANGISENVEELVPTIVDVVLQIVETLTNPDTLSSLIDAAIAIIIALANGLVGALPTLIEQAPVIIQNLVTAIVENVPKLLDAAWEVIKTLVQGLVDNFPEILSAGEEILNSLIEGVEALFTDLYDLGKDIIDEIKDGISKAWQGLTTWFNNLWDSLFGNREVGVTINPSDNTDPPGPKANGISYVPYDGYYALLHEGERVLTAEENKLYNGGARNTSGITIVQNIQAVPQTPVEFAASTAAYFEQARWAI